MRSNFAVLGLVVLCAVIALFVLIKYEGNSGYAISSTYHYVGGQQGIVQKTNPFLQVPGVVGSVNIVESRFPVMIMSDTYGLYDYPKFKAAMWARGSVSVEDQLSCYVTPQGRYVMQRPIDWSGLGKYMGRLFCYANYKGAEAQGIDAEGELRDTILRSDIGCNSIMVHSLATGETKEVPFC